MNQTTSAARRSTPTAVSRLPKDVERAWGRLATGDRQSGHLDRKRLDDAPDPVRRWLGRALQSDAPLGTTAVLAMHGEINIGRRFPFSATQVLAPPHGFIWSARAGTGFVRISGYDRYTDGEGEMQWRVGGLIPVMSAGGPDVTKSAAGRLAGEALLLPASALAPWCRWEPIDHERAIAHIAIGGVEHPVTVEIDDAGALRSVSLPRWGDPDGTGHRQVPFGVSLADPVRHGAIEVPTTLTAGWWWGEPDWSQRAFFRATLDGATEFP